MLVLDLKVKAAEFIKALPPKQSKQIAVAVFDLMKDPRPHDSIKLKGFEDYFRKDVGEYRIVYRFDKSCLYILVIDKRNDNDAYKGLRM